MNVGGGEAADQLVRMMLSGSEVAIRLSDSAAKNALALSMALAKQNKRISGKVNMTRMLRQSRDLRLFPMTPEQYKEFQRQARKQKLLFSAIKDKDDKGRLIDVVMPVTEPDRANIIFERIRYGGMPERSDSAQEQEKDSVRGSEVGAEAPKKDTRSERGSRDTRSRSSTQRTSGSARAENERPSIEERLSGFRAQLDEKRTGVPTVDRGKKRAKAK